MTIEVLLSRRGLPSEPIPPTRRKLHTNTRHQYLIMPRFRHAAKSPSHTLTLKDIDRYLGHERSLVYRLGQRG